MEGFDDWAADQDIEYTLVAKVNDQVAFKVTSYDPDTVIDKVRHAEQAVAELMNDQYQETMPDYDSEAEAERMYQAGEVK